MSSFTLYLDESKQNDRLPYYTVGGLIIEDSVLDTAVRPAVDAIKMSVFGKLDTPLHEYDIREATKSEYQVFNDEKIRTKFWSDLNSLFSSFPYFVISVTISTSAYANRYQNSIKNDEYFVALQLILENFAYFLDKRNSSGNIIIENQNVGKDVMIREHFYSLMNQGTLYLTKKSLQNRILGFRICSKPENNPGLQLADFVPNAMKRLVIGRKQKSPSVATILESKAYDGEVGEKSRFGLKLIDF